MQKPTHIGRSAKAVAACAGLMLLLFPGCVGYQLGSMLPNDIRTIFVPTVVNSTKEPNLESDITQALIQELQKDGSLKVINDETIADSILRVNVTDYRLQPLSYDSLQKTRANEYRLLLQSSVMFTRRATGEVIGQYPIVQGDTDFFFNGDLTSTKRQNLPDAAKDLAHDIVELLVESWE